MEYLFLDAQPCPQKSRRFLHAVFRSARAAGLECSLTTAYRPCKTLVLYGLGGRGRWGPGMEHIKRGGTLISFDLGYWDRALPRRRYRVSINGMHPTGVMAGPRPGPERWHQSGLRIYADRPPVEPRRIMLVGNAPKTIVIGAENWTAKKSKELRSAFPGAEIVFRPKPKRPAESGVDYDVISADPIDRALKGIDLVVTRHSNVAVDACRLGVPVVCDDGAAACIYPQRLYNWADQPGFGVREEFLHRLAYWQWAVTETDKFWQWYLK